MAFLRLRPGSTSTRRTPDRQRMPAMRSDNGLLSGTSGRVTWQGPGNGSAAACDSDTLSGASAEEERLRRCGHRTRQTPSMVQGADLTAGPAPTIPDPDRLLHPGQSEYSYSHSWLFCALEPAHGRAEALAQRPALLQDRRYVEVKAETLTANWPASRRELFGRLGPPDADAVNTFVASRLAAQRGQLSGTEHAEVVSRRWA